MLTTLYYTKVATSNAASLLPELGHQHSFWFLAWIAGPLAFIFLFAYVGAKWEMKKMRERYLKRKWGGIYY